MMKSDASNIRGKLNQIKVKKKRKKIKRKRKIQKKIRKKRKIQKNPKEKVKKSEKGKSKKEEKEKILFSIILDKICVFCLYPIPDFSAIRKEGQL